MRHVGTNSSSPPFTFVFRPFFQPPWWANGAWQWLHVEEFDQSPHRTHFQELGPTCGLASPVLSHDYEGCLLCHWAPPICLIHIHAHPPTQCWTSTDLQYEHLNAGNHSAEASSTSCSWETFWNLTKEQHKMIFNRLFTSPDWHWFLCVFRGPVQQLCDHKPYRNRQNSDAESGSGSSWSTMYQQLFCGLNFAFTERPTSGFGRRLWIINSFLFCHFASHIRVEANADQMGCKMADAELTYDIRWKHICIYLMDKMQNYQHKAAASKRKDMEKKTQRLSVLMMSLHAV